MSTTDIVLNVVDGRRQPFDPRADVLVTARDGTNRDAFRAFRKGGRITVPQLTLRDNFADAYTVLVATKHHRDAGFTPVNLSPTRVETLDLMLLRREAAFEFEPFTRLQTSDPAFFALFTASCAAGDAPAVYARLIADQARHSALACVMNVTTALSHARLLHEDGEPRFVLPYLKALVLDATMAQDRFFAWVDRRLVPRLKAAAAAKAGFAIAPDTLHEGATGSFKQTEFGEGNVQLTMHDPAPGVPHPIVGGVECVLVESDIDYFKDPAAHILLEVFPNTLKQRIFGKGSSRALTDPRAVYGLRWIAGKRQSQTEFAPPYVLV